MCSPQEQTGLTVSFNMLWDGRRVDIFTLKKSTITSLMSSSSVPWTHQSRLGRSNSSFKDADRWPLWLFTRVVHLMMLDS